MMKSFIKKFSAFLLVCVFILGTLPVNAEIIFNETPTARRDYTVEEITAEDTEFWQKIEPLEKNILEKKADKHTYMQEAYKLISKQPNVRNLEWDDEDTFSFVFSKGMTCVYDYDLRMVDLKNEKPESEGSIEVYDYSQRGTHTTSCKNTYVFGPYYGEDDSFTDYYENLGRRIALAKGGTCTVLSGSAATMNAIRTAAAQPDVCAFIFDTHGITFPENGSREPSSYVGVASSTAGVSSADLYNVHVVSLSGGKYGIDGYFITRMGKTQMSDCIVWMAACESMMTYGLGYPFIFSGAKAVYGYSQSISFTRDYQWAGVFWDDMLDGKTVQYAAADMKAQYSVPDPYGGVNAYPIFMWDDGSGDALSTYPANPDSAQTVTSQWRLINNDPQYTVTFKDWDNTTLSTQTVYRGEDATAPSNPTRVGHTFTGWDKTFTNVQSNLTVTAQYRINTYIVTFVDGITHHMFHTEEVNHGGNVTFPTSLIPDHPGYTFTGWDSNGQNITSDVSITANYVKTTCTVTFNDWDGTTLKTQQVSGGGSATPPADPVRAGYTFTGWSGSYTNVQDDITLIAQYEPDSIRVRFVDWNGTVLKDYNTTYGSLPVAPYQNPTREGYTFKGWNYALTYPVYVDTTYTAQYDINVYAVYFLDYNNAVLKTEYVNHGSDATPPANPTRAGYRFVRWDASYTNVTQQLYIHAVYEVYNAPQISVETAYGRSGQDVAVNILLANNEGISNASFTISYDTSKLTYKSAQNGEIMSSMTVSGNTFTFTNASSTNANGTLCTITFTVASNIDTGVSVPISFTSSTITERVTGNVIINNFVVGDVNNDGLVNTLDATKLLRYLAGMEQLDTRSLDAADINRNGNVTTQDVVYLLKYCAEDSSVYPMFGPSAGIN